MRATIKPLHARLLELKPCGSGRLIAGDFLMRGPKPGRVSENEIAFAVCQIASVRPDGVVSFFKMKKEIPNYIALSAADRVQSETRPNEELWEQLIRNIKSHSKSDGNYIHAGYLQHLPRVGYRVTSTGRQHVAGGQP
jgi:hypothetical protein